MHGVRTRMAPSPTGEYHIGHIRTVLYNYAFAKKNGGKFLLRIEDTDQERYVEGATERILEVIKDYHLDWDEGPIKGGEYGPYTQSERLPIYKEYVDKLIDKGMAYYCFCTKERLDEMREAQMKEGLSKTMYDGHCRNLTREEVEQKLSQNTPYVVRLKVPKDEVITFTDAVFGEISFESNEVDDTVLLKSDGFPTYHLAVVVDDHLMKITHVMRGNDWLPSTPKHILLHRAFGWDLPTYVHLPNLKEKGENRKLSKRFGAVFALDFLKEGYIVDALLNFLMFLGWNPGTEKEIYSLEEFVEDFDISRIHKTDLVSFDREKLIWINGLYIRSMPQETLLSLIETWAKKFEVDLHAADFDSNYKTQVIALVQERMKTFSEFVELTHYFFSEPTVDNQEILKHTQTNERKVEIIDAFIELYKSLPEKEFNAKDLEHKSHDLVNKLGFKTKEAFMTLRVAVTGESATPPIMEIIELLGKERTLKRLVKQIK